MGYNIDERVIYIMRRNNAEERNNASVFLYIALILYIYKANVSMLPRIYICIALYSFAAPKRLYII